MFLFIGRKDTDFPEFISKDESKTAACITANGCLQL
jgi:hypothetical protein